MNPLDADDLLALATAVTLLENPGFAARLANLAGSPVEKTLQRLPLLATDTLHNAARVAISKAFDTALLTLRDEPGKAALTRQHKMLSGVSGALGGFFGAPALAIELPVSTTIMMRGIAAIARSEGESISAPGAKLACLEVFAIGGNSAADDATDSGYYTVRAALSAMISEAVKAIGERGLTDAGAPVLVRLISAVAQRFGLSVSQKLAAQLVPAIGAIGGASINLLFMEHFQTMARGHFIVRRLERKYGEPLIREQYRLLAER